MPSRRAFVRPGYQRLTTWSACRSNVLSAFAIGLRSVWPGNRSHAYVRERVADILVNDECRTSLAHEGAQAIVHGNPWFSDCLMG